MKGMGKRIGLWTAVGLLAVLAAFPAYGAKRKAIPSISLDIEAHIEPETDFGDETIDIEAKSDRFSVDGYEIMNVGFGWEEDTIPELRITLHADDDYYFKTLSKDKIKLSGGVRLKATKRENSSGTLLMDVELPSLQNTLQPIEEVKLGEDGIATWTRLPNAGEYEVRVMRQGKMVGSSLKTNSPIINCRKKMTKGSTSYTVRVRATNKYDPEIKGEWYESAGLYVNADMAKSYRLDPKDLGRARWEQKADGRWTYIKDDGTRPENAWLEIDGKWYFFDAGGFMRTGWIRWNGKDYYCSENGDMLTNCITPDSYMVGADGAKIAQ